MIALIEIVSIVVILISFLLPHHTLIHQPLTYHSYHWPLSLPLVYQHLLSNTLLLFILQQHLLLLMSIPIASPRLVCQGSLLENLWMESSSPTLCYPLSTSPSSFIGENSVDENVPEHIQIGMSYKDYTMMINPLIYNPFLDWIVHFQRELPLPNCSFWLETVELREPGEEPGEIVLVNHVPTLWINKNIPLILDDLIQLSI